MLARIVLPFLTLTFGWAGICTLLYLAINWMIGSSIVVDFVVALLFAAYEAVIFRLSLVQYRMDKIEPLLVMMFSQQCYEFNKSIGKQPLTKLNKSVVKLEPAYRRRIVRSWLHNTYKDFVYGGYYFKLAPTIPAMAESLRPAEESDTAFDFKVAEFVLTPNATSADYYALGFEVFRLVTESAMNANIARSDWAFCFERDRGVGVRLLSEN